jgi:hypothetical protein
MRLIVINVQTLARLETTSGDLERVMNKPIDLKPESFVTAQLFNQLAGMQGMNQCDCSNWFIPSYGEFKRCPNCLSNQHTAAGF